MVRLKIKLPELYLPGKTKFNVESLGWFDLESTRIFWDLVHNELYTYNYIINCDEEKNYFINEEILQATTEKIALELSIPIFSSCIIYTRNGPQKYEGATFLRIYLNRNKHHQIYLNTYPYVLFLDMKGEIILQPGEKIIEMT